MAPPARAEAIPPVFFQAEDGIRDLTVTGVQTCALPIYAAPRPDAPPRTSFPATRPGRRETGASQGGAPQALPQAAGLARARPAPAPAPGSGVAGDRRGIRDPGFRLRSLHHPDGRDPIGRASCRGRV